MSSTACAQPPHSRSTTTTTTLLLHNVPEWGATTTRSTILLLTQILFIGLSSAQVGNAHYSENGSAAQPRRTTTDTFLPGCGRLAPSRPAVYSSGVEGDRPR